MIKIVKLFGIEIKANLSLIPIILLGIFFGFLRELILILIIVTVHELAHGIVSNYFGHEAKTVELFLFGGEVVTDEIVFLAAHEVILISIVGPMVNFFLALLGIVIYKLFAFTDSIVPFFIYSNLSLGVFNLLPIMPLDGGRILRALLSKRQDIREATFTTIYIGNIICMILFVLGIILLKYSLNGLILIPFSIFLLVKNNREKENIYLEYLRRVFTKPKGLQRKLDIKIKRITVNEHISLKDILKCLTVGSYCIVRVVNRRGKIIGELTEAEILEAIIKCDSLTTLDELLQKKKNGIQ